MMINNPINLINFQNQKTLVLLFAYPTTKHLDVRIDEQQLALTKNLCPLPTNHRRGPRLALNLL